MIENCQKPYATLLLAGIGNELLMDDGVGIHVTRLLKNDPIPGVVTLEVGTDFMSMAPHVESYPKLLIIDAMDAGGEPGTIFFGTFEELAPHQERMSAHEFGLKSMLEFVEPRLRPRIYVLGIQPETIGFGLDLTPRLKARLPVIFEAARATALRLVLNFCQDFLSGMSHLASPATYSPPDGQRIQNASARKISELTGHLS